MEKIEYVFSKLADMTVSMQTQEQKNMTLLRGRALLCEADRRFTFIQNQPRGARSEEVGRSDHARVVRRPDGKYTLTFRFCAEEKMLKETLISEVRNLVEQVIKDAKEQKKEQLKEIKTTDKQQEKQKRSQQ